MLGFMGLLFRNCIVSSLSIIVIILLQRSVMKSYCNIIKVLWMIIIVNGICIIKPYSVSFEIYPKQSVRNFTTNTAGHESSVVLSVLFGIWIVVALVLFVLGMVGHYRVLRDFKDVIYDEDNIYLSKYVSVAFTHGFIKPKIIISANIVGDEREFVLKHERQHIRGKDNLIKLLYFIVCCIYWFNPIMWIGRKYFEYCIELACDERAVRDYSKMRAYEYASYMAGFAGAGDVSVGSLGFIKSDLSMFNRVSNILSKREDARKVKLFAALLFPALLMTVFVGVRFESVILEKAETAGYSSVGEYHIKAYIDEVDGIQGDGFNWMFKTTE